MKIKTKEKLKCVECGGYMKTKDNPKYNEICKKCRIRLFREINRLNEKYGDIISWKNYAQ